MYSESIHGRDSSLTCASSCIKYSESSSGRLQDRSRQDKSKIRLWYGFQPRPILHKQNMIIWVHDPHKDAICASSIETLFDAVFSKALRRHLPRLNASGGGTAFPICLCLLCTLPQNWKLSGKPCNALGRWASSKDSYAIKMLNEPTQLCSFQCSALLERDYTPKIRA